MKSLDLIEVEQKLDDLSLQEKIIIPEHIKDMIKSKVGEFKELMKDDLGFADNIIFAICNVGNLILPSAVWDGFYMQYGNKTPWPVGLKEAAEIASSLAFLPTGRYSEILYKFIKHTYPNNSEQQISDKCDLLSNLIKSEIGYQFNPTASYQIENSRVDHMGEGSFDESDFL